MRPVGTAIDFGSAEMWVRATGAFKNQNRPELAFHCCERAIEINPLHPVAWYEKGDYFITIKKYPESLRCVEESLVLDPKFWAAELLRAANFTLLGRKAEAISSFRRFLSLKPPSGTAPAEVENLTATARKQLARLEGEPR